MSLQRILADQLATPETGEAAGLAHLPGERPTRVFVRDLVLEGDIGVYEHERIRPQRIRFNVELGVRLPPGGPRQDCLSEVLSYEDMVNRIREILAEGHVNLCETLAERVAQRELADPRVVTARVRVEKLDVYAGATVGVEIERQAPAATSNVAPLLRVLSGS
jgi:dihydroneopterin aldolase